MVYVIADIHGSALSLQQDMKYMPELTKDDYIIIAGDAGLEYGQYSMGSLKKYMMKLPCTFIVMRGNHDNRYHDQIPCLGKFCTQTLSHGTSPCRLRPYMAHF